MKKVKNILFLSILLQSCLPYSRITSIDQKREPLSKNTTVAILNTEQPIPENSEYIGGLAFGDTWFSIGNFDKKLNVAKEKSKIMGANILKLEKISRGKLSRLYKINASLYSKSTLENIDNISNDSLIRQYAKNEIEKIKIKDSIPNTNYARNSKGQLDFIFTIPEVNHFYFEPIGFEKRSSTGFVGAGLGLEYYYQHQKSIRLVATYSMNLKFIFPVPLRYYGIQDYFNSTSIAVTENYNFKKFSLGYGLHYSQNNWNQFDYSDEFWRTLAYNTPPILTSNHSLGIVANSFYRIGKHFVLGVNYQPSIYRVKPIAIFKYEHLISLHLLWKWKIKKDTSF